jgi:hypothetical protein
MKVMRNGKVFTQGATYAYNEKRKIVERLGHENAAINEIHNNTNLSRDEKIAAAKEILNGIKETAAAKKANDNKSKVCIIANNLIKSGVNRSTAFKKAWEIVKAEKVETRITGVTFGNRQKALERLTNYSAEQISISLEREAENEFDKNAIAVKATVKGKGGYIIGYINKNLAKLIAPLIDYKKSVTATFQEIVGKYQNYHNYGLQISVNIAKGII